MDEIGRINLVRSAGKHVKNGGTPADFAKKHGLARSTVIGWCKNHKGPRGRPRRLEPFNETKILELLSTESGVHSWRTVQGLVRRQSGERMERRSIFRLLKKWRLSPVSTPPIEIPTITASEWIQPAETVNQRHDPLRLILWRMLSGRGMEWFMLTSENSAAAAGKVAAAAVGCFKNRKRELRTNNPYLAESLRGKLKGWRVDLAMD